MKMVVIPPADMQYLVDNGLAPSKLPNWNRDDPDSLWYVGYRKFTPERKEAFLSKLSTTGRIGLSCWFAGIDHSTVCRHRNEDPEFDAACKLACDIYQESVAATITHQARAGQIDERYDKEGNLLSRRVTYEQQLRLRLLQRADPSYTDVSKQEVSVIGGAVVVPAPIDNVESWDDVVRRHTGGTAVSNSPLAGANEPAGERALAEGRVVKRIVLDTSGESDDNEGKEAE